MKQRGLAGATLADDCNHLSLADFELETTKDGDLLHRSGEDFGEIDGSEESGHVNNSKLNFYFPSTIDSTIGRFPKADRDSIRIPSPSNDVVLAARGSCTTPCGLADVFDQRAIVSIMPADSSFTEENVNTAPAGSGRDALWN